MGADSKEVTDKPTFVVDLETNSVFLFYQTDDGKLLYLCSKDNGKSFGEEVDVTEILDVYKKEYPWVSWPLVMGTASNYAPDDL